ncbi:unnamed protein product (macronuclear) [Paramecium tetraurelia]|uniref:ubiquitinyl hydrolase 1 n=1 Tax=Paramecium tetraurelia TaxID=5888 RepID=A0CQD9_PARTE|nr:uncharacterized protein GSPATT00009354001 [Paramecium tetraurelia]CAK73006.1 unnamed protein product [Paramecium tetraurelia]|eukprot:XP_001440403.1 hypothetical protein (macronuclear) [Paramecium tetraurelia strain d4-2]
MQEKFYHEKQKLQLCGLASVNNLLQGQLYTAKTMNDLANQLPKVENTFFNFHSSFFKIGNYSADLLTTALEQKGKRVLYFDKRKLENLQTIVQENEVVGLLIHNFKKGLIKDTNHWFPILQKNQLWYNLDSKLKEYICLGNFDKLIDFLKKELQNLSMFIVLDDINLNVNANKQNEHSAQDPNKQQVHIQQEQIVDRKEYSDNDNLIQQKQQQQEQNQEQLQEFQQKQQEQQQEFKQQQQESQESLVQQQQEKLDLLKQMDNQDLKDSNQQTNN